MKYRYTLLGEELIALLRNGRWFAGFKVAWKPIGKRRYRVITNYSLTGRIH